MPGLSCLPDKWPARAGFIHGPSIPANRLDRLRTRVQAGQRLLGFSDATQARSAAKRLGVGAILRRNINVIGKDRREKDWWVERIRNWNGNRFVDIKK